MRLSLDELKVAEVAARNYPVGGFGNTSDGKDCPLYALQQYVEPNRRTDVGSPFYTSGAPASLVMLVLAKALHFKYAEDAAIEPWLDLGMFQEIVSKNPTSVADDLATIIKCAEMSAAYKPTLLSGRSVRRLDEPNAGRDRSQYACEDGQVLALASEKR